MQLQPGNRWALANARIILKAHHGNFFPPTDTLKAVCESAQALRDADPTCRGIVRVKNPPEYSNA
jgi:hypothetical protein